MTLGYLEVIDNVQDKRTKTTLMTAEGSLALQRVRSVLAEHEANLAHSIGARAPAILRSILTALAG
jgi:DNA-binding MarR family transcriptional regulator